MVGFPTIFHPNAAAAFACSRVTHTTPAAINTRPESVGTPSMLP
jgi:hypothetical protein